MVEFGGVGLLILTSRLSRAEKMQTHVLGSRVQNLFFSSDEVERWSGVGHAHGVRNQCTSDEFWGTSSARQVPMVATLVKNNILLLQMCVSMVSEGRTVHASDGYCVLRSVCRVLRCAWHLGVSDIVLPKPCAMQRLAGAGHACRLRNLRTGSVITFILRQLFVLCVLDGIFSRPAG